MDVRERNGTTTFEMEDKSSYIRCHRERIVVRVLPAPQHLDLPVDVPRLVRVLRLLQPRIVGDLDSDGPRGIRRSQGTSDSTSVLGLQPVALQHNFDDNSGI